MNRKQPRRPPRRTGWRPSLVGSAAALAAVAVAVLAQAVSADRAAATHWAGRSATALVAAGARTATPTLALPSTADLPSTAAAGGEAHWRVLPGVGPAVLTAGVGAWPGSSASPLLVGIGDRPAAPFARLGELQRGQVVVLRQPEGTAATYRVTAVEFVPSGTPILPGGSDSLTLWAISSSPGGSSDTVVRAAAVR